MIRTFRWTLILFILASPLSGLDLELSTGLGNLYWAPGRTDTPSGRTFQGSDWYWNAQGSVAQDLSEGLQFKGGVASDPILRWRAYSQLGYTFDHLTVEFAPFLGVFSTQQKWFNPGLNAEVGYTWPGLLFLRGGFLTTFAPLSRTGDYYLSSQNVSVGFLMENGIVTFHIEDKQATFRTSDTVTTVDEATKYWMDTEMFLKNFPLRWALITGFQITNRSYVTTAEDSTPIYSALLGVRFSWDFGEGTSAYLETESSVFNYGLNQTTMNLPDSIPVLDTVIGMRYHW